ncbi:MAG: hypothetical protein F6J86_30535 [Symploca sp. SIO1B1]|nr:hypothetical protein [Symploca sp. SIO1B1]
MTVRSENRRNRQLSVRMTEELLDRLRTEAAGRGIPLAQLVTQLLEKGLAAEEEELTVDLVNLHKRVELLEELVISQSTKHNVA